MKEYSIFFASYKLTVISEKDDFKFPDYIKEFTNPIDYVEEFHIEVRDIEKLPKSFANYYNRPILCHTERFDLYDIADSWVFCENNHEIEKNSVLVCNRDYKNITLYMANDYFPLSSLIRVACESGVATMAGLPLHASLIEKDGQGILFLGQSGIGKSTQAKLWKQYEDADFICGDRPMVRKIAGKWYGFGMPWDGKDGLFRQISVPVKALISLDKGTENHLERLNSIAAMKVLLNQVMMPMWDKEAMDEMSSLMWQLANDIEFYQLRNKADSESVALVKEILG